MFGQHCIALLLPTCQGEMLHISNTHHQAQHNQSGHSGQQCGLPLNPSSIHIYKHHSPPLIVVNIKAHGIQREMHSQKIMKQCFYGSTLMVRQHFVD